MAFSKMAGFEVTPLTPSSSISFFYFPDAMISRSIKSSQMLCPKLCICFTLLVAILLGCFKVHYLINEADVLFVQMAVLPPKPPAFVL